MKTEKEKKNRIWWTFLLVLVVVAGLLGLFYLPRINVGDVDLRRVNILSDVQRRDKDGNIVAELVADSLDGFVEKGVDSAAIRVKQLAYVDTVPEKSPVREDPVIKQAVDRTAAVIAKAVIHIVHAFGYVDMKACHPVIGLNHLFKGTV